MLKVGNPVPDFTVATDTGSLTLSDMRGKNVVIFFFPKADTSGCTAQSIAFSQLQAEFDAANTVILGLSKDTPQKQAKFRAKHNLTCLLGADHETDICEQFGVWVEKSMYGRKYMGIQRATFLIGPNGNLNHVWPKVKVPGHAEAVLAEVQPGG